MPVLKLCQEHRINVFDLIHCFRTAAIRGAVHGVRTEPRPKIPALRQLAKRQSSTRRGRYIAELRNALGYSIRVARRKIVEVAKQWMQDAKQGPVTCQ